MESASPYIPIAITLPLVVAIIWCANWFLLKRQTDLGNERKFSRQLTILALVIAGIIAVAMALPVNVSTRNQIIAFTGLVVSGIFAFSSTTVFANLMAGLMLRITRPFRAGDFIEVDHCAGRVSERGLLDTEIQTETRQLVAIPNTYLITNPVSVMRSSGTIISVSLSLGYDIHHSTVSDLLKKAAQDCGLEEPYVHVRELGDFSVTYSINGLLTDVKNILTMRSQLSCAVLDSLHGAGIEIVSPGFMNQRPLQAGETFIPVEKAAAPIVKPESAAEAIVFDKAEEAEKKELEELRIQQRIELLETKLADLGGEDRSVVESELTNLKAALKDLQS